MTTASPVPPYLRVVELSAGWRSGTTGHAGQARPMPLSRTAKAEGVSLAGARARHGEPLAGFR